MVEIKVQCWSGNYRPFIATVYVDGKYAGRSGACKSEGAAQRAGEAIAARKSAK